MMKASGPGTTEATMRQWHTDLAPILAILVGGAIGASFTARLQAPAPSPEAREVDEVSVREAAALATPHDLPIRVAALQLVDGLIEQQRGVRREVGELSVLDDAERATRMTGIRLMKAEMHRVVAELERDLDGAAFDAQGPDLEAAAPLSQAAEVIRERKLKEAFQYSGGTIEQWDPQSADAMERMIHSDLEEVRARLVSGWPALIYVNGVRVSATAVMTLGAWVRSEDPLTFDGTAVSAAVESWLAAEGRAREDTRVTLAGVEVVRGADAVDRFGLEATGGAVSITLLVHD